MIYCFYEKRSRARKHQLCDKEELLKGEISYGVFNWHRYRHVGDEDGLI